MDIFRRGKEKIVSTTEIKKDYKYAVHIRILEARNIQADDGKETTAQPYCKVETVPSLNGLSWKKVLKSIKLEKKTASELFQTAVAKNTCYPVWNEDCTLFVENEDEYILAQLYDWKRLQKHTHLGLCHISVNDLKLSKKSILHQWFDLYDIDNKRKKRGRVYLILCFSDISMEPIFHFDNYNASTGEYISARSSLLNSTIHTEYNPRSFVSTKTNTLHDFDALKEADTKRNNMHGIPIETSIWIATWNCGNARPPDDLSPWLPKASDGYDIIAIGSQECDYQRRKDMLGQPVFNSCGRDWISHLMWHFGSGYQLVTSCFLLQIRLVVFVRRELSSRIEDVNVSHVATGIGNVVGNKGGVCISMSFNQTTLCFINAHLAAHQDKIVQRNRDAEMIINGLDIPGFDSHIDIANRFDHIFFCGDLNYRCNYGNSTAHTPPIELFEDMCNKIDQGGSSMAQIFGTDQLVEEMRNQRVFCGFREGYYTFKPTFKVLRNESLTYFSQRAPAWCDRILWKTAAGKKIIQTKLDSANSLLTSDHKPVYSSFSLISWMLPPSIDPTMGKAQLSFEHLECKITRPYPSTEAKAQPNIEDLPINPYFKFTCPMFSNMLQINNKKHDLSPIWNDDDDMKVILTANNLYRLKCGHITAQLKNKLQLRKISRSSETIGFGTIPIDLPSSKSDLKIDVTTKDLYFQYNFNSLITIGGLSCATVKGSIRITWLQEYGTANSVMNILEARSKISTMSISELEANEINNEVNRNKHSMRIRHSSQSYSTMNSINTTLRPPAKKKNDLKSNEITNKEETKTIIPKTIHERNGSYIRNNRSNSDNKNNIATAPSLPDIPSSLSSSSTTAVTSASVKINQNISNNNSVKLMPSFVDDSDSDSEVTIMPTLPSLPPVQMLESNNFDSSDESDDNQPESTNKPPLPQVNQPQLLAFNDSSDDE